MRLREEMCKEWRAVLPKEVLEDRALKTATIPYNPCHTHTLRSGATGFLRPRKRTHIYSIRALRFLCWGASDALEKDQGRLSFCSRDMLGRCRNSGGERRRRVLGGCKSRLRQCVSRADGPFKPVNRTSETLCKGLTISQSWREAKWSEKR